MIKVGENVTLSGGAKPEKAATDQIRAKVLLDIGTKWNKLSEADMAKVTNTETLGTMLVERYGLEGGQAHRDIRTFLNGRHF